MLLLKLAFRNIFRQKRRSLLTSLSMAGGYLLCTLSVSLSEGSYNNAIKFFTEDHTGHIQIHKENYLTRPKIHKTIAKTETVSQQLSNMPEIKSHTLRVFAPALAYSESKNTQARVVGIDLALEQKTSRLIHKVSEGEYINSAPNEDGYYSAMIGLGIASSLSLTIGDELILISQGADGSIANDIYIVNSIIGNKNSIDKSYVYLPLAAAQEFLSMGNNIHEVSILLHDDKKAEETAANLQLIFPGLTVSPWQVVEQTFFKSMQADKDGMRVSLGIITFIVFVGVLNTVLMSVLERTREFGVLKAIGSRPSRVALLITLETSLLSTMSIAVGFVFCAPLIYWFSTVGIQLSEALDMGGVKLEFMTGDFTWYVFSMPAFMIICFSLLVSIPTGIRAARISPTEAMGSH